VRQLRCCATQSSSRAPRPAQRRTVAPRRSRGAWNGDAAALQILPAIERLLDAGQAIDAVTYDEWGWDAEALRLERDRGLRLVSFPARGSG